MILSGLISGALLGFVMQRGRFCLTGGFRDMYIAKNNRMFYALLIAISVQSVGVFALIQAGLLTYEARAFPWLGTVIGGYIFGLPICFSAGGCATGTWYRAGEGLIGSWIALHLYGDECGDAFSTCQWFKSNLAAPAVLNITLLLRLLICLCGRWLPFCW